MLHNGSLDLRNGEARTCPTQGSIHRQKTWRLPDACLLHLHHACEGVRQPYCLPTFDAALVTRPRDGCWAAVALDLCSILLKIFPSILLESASATRRRQKRRYMQPGNAVAGASVTKAEANLFKSAPNDLERVHSRLVRKAEVVGCAKTSKQAVQSTLYSDTPVHMHPTIGKIEAWGVPPLELLQQLRSGRKRSLDKRDMVQCLSCNMAVSPACASTCHSTHIMQPNFEHYQHSTRCQGCECEGSGACGQSSFLFLEAELPVQIERSKVRACPC